MEDKEYSIDLVDMAKLLKENRKPIIRMTGLFIAISCVFLLIALLFFPKYQSDALLRIKQERGSSGLMAAMAGFTGGFLSQDSLQMESYVEILKSRSVVIPVIEATEEADSDGKYPRYENYVKDRISIKALQMTDLLELKVKGETDEKAQKVNQLLISGFLKRIADLNTSEKSALKGFLEERVKTAREELDKTETELQKYKVENRIISPDATADIFADRIAEAEKQLAANKIELEAAEARAAAINSQLHGTGSASADNQILQQYKKQLAELETTRISYKEKYTEKHPKMIDLEDRIAQLKTKIREEQAQIATLQAPSDNVVHQGLVAGKYSSEAAVSVLRQKAQALQQVVDQNNAELAKLPGIERGYIKLARDYKVANEIYAMLIKKLEETKVTEFQAPNNVQVVDAPTLPDRRSFPQLKFSLALAALLGLILSCGYVIVKEIFHKTIRNIEDVQQFLRLPVIGGIPDEIALANTMAIQEPKELTWRDKLKEFIWKD